MGIRETLNQNQKLTTGATAAIILVALIYIVMSFFKSGPTTRASNQAYYTVDDGATYFTESANKVPPFDYQGKQAVRVHMYTCDGGKNKFIGYLERFTPQAKAAYEKALQSQNSPTPQGPPPQAILTGLQMSGVEIKPPKGGQWALRMTPTGSKTLAAIKCTSGSPDNMEEVQP